MIFYSFFFFIFAYSLKINAILHSALYGIFYQSFCNMLLFNKGAKTKQSQCCCFHNYWEIHSGIIGTPRTKWLIWIHTGIIYIYKFIYLHSTLLKRLTLYCANIYRLNIALSPKFGIYLYDM